MDARARITSTGAVERLRSRDTTLYTDDAEVAVRITGHLGWTTLAADADPALAHAERIAAAAREGPVLVVTRARHTRTLRDAGVALEVRLDTRRHLLYATDPVQ